jgi:hypothetical protein
MSTAALSLDGSSASLLYYLMFNKFFDMDMMETMVCAAIIWVMRTWVVYFLVAAILSGIGFEPLQAEARTMTIRPPRAPSKTWKIPGTQNDSSKSDPQERRI